MEQDISTTGARPRVLVTGASGLVGGLVVRGLSDRYEFDGLSQHKPADPTGFTRYWEASVENRLWVPLAGLDAVLHLAAPTGPADDWDAEYAVTIGGTWNVLRAAQEAGIKRFVLMSSGSTMCGWERESPYGELVRGDLDKIAWIWLNSQRDPARPDSPFAVAKLAAEGMGRYFSDTYDMQVIVIRLGAVTAEDRPMKLRQYPGWLSQRDAVSMIDCALRAPESIRFGIFDAISENARRWRDTTPAKELLGWQPLDHSEAYELP